MSVYPDLTMPPLVVMTCDKSSWTLDGFFAQLRRYCEPYPTDIVVYGYSKPDLRTRNLGAKFVSIGEFEDYPPEKWSDSFIWVLGDLAATGVDTFWLMLDDYWITRHVNMQGVMLLNDLIRKSPDILKIDLVSDRLFAHGGTPYLYNKNTAFHWYYFDMIESLPDSPYHMSLWGGLWRTDLLRQVIIPGERAQEIEIAGSGRLSQIPEIKVYGTRQIPVLHTNILQGGKPPNYDEPLPISQYDLTALKGMGVLR
jgi:hypothetical protein